MTTPVPDDEPTSWVSLLVLMLSIGVLVVTGVLVYGALDDLNQQFLLPLSYVMKAGIVIGPVLCMGLVKSQSLRVRIVGTIVGLIVALLCFQATLLLSDVVLRDLPE